MFTVVISEQTHLDNIAQYKPFLKPFMEQPGVAFCRWRQNGNNLEEAVPDLFETVARQKSWRAVVVCDEEGIGLQNPFDLVRYQAPERTEANVAIMPIFFVLVTSSARRQVGSTTPTIGRSFSACKTGSGVVVTVPQAIRIALRSKDRRNRTS